MLVKLLILQLFLLLNANALYFRHNTAVLKWSFVKKHESVSLQESYDVLMIIKGSICTKPTL